MEREEIIFEVTKSLEQMTEIFDKKEKEFAEVRSLLEDAGRLLNTIQYSGSTGDYYPMGGGDDVELKMIIAKWKITYHHLMDYYDIRNKKLNDDILKNLTNWVRDAKLYLAERAEGKRKMAPEPDLSVLLLRLCVCGVNIKYRKKEFPSGLEIVKQINEVVNSEEFKVHEQNVSPALLAELYFEEGKLLVRLNRNDDAEPLFNKAVRKYEDWENWKQEKGTNNHEATRNFITYRICVTQAFSIYSHIQQGRIESVVREASTIERLLEYTTHKKLQRFVRTLRAKALRLSGFQHPNQLRNVLKLLQDNQFYVDESKPEPSKMKTDGDFSFYNYQRHFLMNLFQQGVTYIYLLFSQTTPDKGLEADSLNHLQHIIDEMTELQSASTGNEYWQIRINLLKIYILLYKKEFDTALGIAKSTIKLPFDNIHLKVEAEVALLEVAVEYLRVLERESDPLNPPEDVVIAKKEIRSDTCAALERCEEIERNLILQTDSKTKADAKGPAKMFALYYLLKCDFLILEGKFEEAQGFWKKWNDVASEIELSRWVSKAVEIKHNLEHAEKKLTIDFSDGYQYKRAKDVLENWLYQRVKREYGTDVKRINALDVSREKFYTMKQKFDPEPNPIKKRRSKTEGTE